MVKPESELEGVGPLPRGRHGIAPEEVAAHQRERLIAAICRVVAERGYGALTVARVLEPAGVSRSTFYTHFGNKREAVLVAHGTVFERFLAALERACAGETEWPLKVRSAVLAAVGFAAGRPEQTQILMTGSLNADPALAERIVASQERLARLLEGARADSPYAEHLPKSTEQFLVAGIGSFIASCLARDEIDRLRAVRSQLVQLTLIPYCGHDEAARVAELPE